MTTSLSSGGIGMQELLQQRQNALESRPLGPRTYKPLRKRIRTTKLAEDIPSASPLVVDEMEGDRDTDTRTTEEEPEEVIEDDLIDRTTLCLPDYTGNSILHQGYTGFKDVLRHYCPTPESNATERLVGLKTRLKTASTHDFWGILMEEMCDITGSQCGFVAKRLLIDDQDIAVEMPRLGEEGSCLMGVAFYINNGADVKEMYRDYRYHAYGTPCAHMRHDKVFIVPERLQEFCPKNPNVMPWKQSEAFIGVPLFHDGKCFAHFGMIWSSDQFTKRRLSWTFIEMFLHSLEDMILQRILEGRGFAKESSPPDSKPGMVVPLSAITASQSLKPYARSLSHELRTPMQGVVGMLDIMYATVLDAIATQPSDHVRTVFKDLKAGIESVQDSSRRAVEAADNVVHAYDMDMQMPDTPLTPNDFEMVKGLVTPGSDISPPTSRKRERNDELGFFPGPPLKRMFSMTEAEIIRSYYPNTSTLDGPMISITQTDSSTKPSSVVSTDSEPRYSPLLSPAIYSPTLRRVFTREFMRSLISEALRNGHPTSEVHSETDLGEKIDVQTIGSRGEIQQRTIYLEIETDVPEVIITEEQYLQFALQKLVDNAMKFTESGSISISVKIASNAQTIEIWVIDTGCGISEESKTNLFKPHFQQDSSIIRSRDGLGLSLFNAKAHVRKNLGGDLTLQRSNTEGPARGSEFLIRLPLNTNDNSIEEPLVGTSGGSPRTARSSPNPETMPLTPDLSTALVASTAKPRMLKRPTHRKRHAHQSFNPTFASLYPSNILIAEDNPVNRSVLTGSLAKLGYRPEDITVTFDGVDCLETFKKSLGEEKGKRFDLVLMDIWMPRMDGYAASQAIMGLAREANRVSPGAGKHGDVKIVAVTADVTGESVEKAKGSGMCGFLAKPFKVGDLERVLGDVFGERCC